MQNNIKPFRGSLLHIRLYLVYKILTGEIIKLELCTFWLYSGKLFLGLITDWCIFVVVYTFDPVYDILWDTENLSCSKIKCIINF